MANKQSTTPQFLTQEKLRAIAAGLGRGLMAYDPNNPFAGAGAALATVAGIEEERALRNQNFAEQRQTLTQQQEFSASQRKQAIADARAARDEERAYDEKMRPELRKERLEDIKESEQLKFDLAKKQREEIASGLKNQKAFALGLSQFKNPSFNQDFASSIPEAPRASGTAPTQYLDSLLEDGEQFRTQMRALRGEFGR